MPLDPRLNAPVKLLAPVPSLPYFTSDQVLTATQLNDLVLHLNHADRATRAWLVGCGVVCGLTHQRQGASVLLQPGCALTTDGDLLALATPTRFTHTRPFADADAKYAPLAAFAPLLELLPETGARGDSTAEALTEAALDDTVLILYLESFAREPRFCTGESCEVRAPFEHSSLRLLLVPRARVPALAPGLPAIAEALPPPQCARPRLGSGIKKLEGTDGLQAAFTTAIAASRASVLATLDPLATNAAFAHALTQAGFEALPNWGALLPGANLNPAVEIRGLLHVFEFFRDFCRAAEEWRQSLYGLDGYCAPAPEGFPRHVLLGETGRAARCPTDPWRHPFHRACAAHAPGGLERARLLWQRLRALASGFSATTATPQIRITPSVACSRPLGERALPFYYGETYAGPWNVEAHLRCAPDQPASYHRQPELAFAADACACTFYRVEGHLGRPLAEVEKTLQALRAQHNLAFQILAVQIEDDPDRVRIPPIRFFDLESLFHQNRIDLKLRLSDVDGYTTKVVQGLNDGRDRLPADTNTNQTSLTLGTFGRQAREALDQLPVKLTEFNETRLTGFMGKFTEAVKTGHEVNRATSALQQNIQITPAERFVQPETPTRLGQIMDIWNKRKRKVAELSVFQKFVQNNPGLEHLGGVAAGGTLVLVYTASTEAAGQIVKADFALPYFSTFDMSTIEPEEPPVEPDVPQKPPFIFPVLPWKDFYDWKVTPITPVVMDRKLTDFTAHFETTVNTRITQSVTDQFKVINGLGSIFNVTATPGTRLPGTINPGLSLGTIAADPAYADIAGAITRNASEIEQLREQKARGVAPRDVDERITKLETHTADLVSKANDVMGEKITAAEAAGKEISAADRAMAQAVKTTALTLETPEARATAKTSFTTMNTKFGTSPFIKTSFGGLPNAF